MAKVTPCEAGYDCPYCRQVDNSHTVSLLPHCPIVWIGESDVFDTLTGERMPFVQRHQSKQRKDDNAPFLLPILENHAGKKRQVGLYRVWRITDDSFIFYSVHLHQIC